MVNTAIINLRNNIDGLCINVAHDNYSIVPQEDWSIVIGGEVIVKNGGEYIFTGLKIWQ